MVFFRVGVREAVIIEGWDKKYLRTVTKPGLHVKEPDVLAKIVKRVNMDIYEEKFDVSVQSSDKVYAKIPVTLQLCISDPYSYYYNADNPGEMARGIVVDSLKKLCSVYTLEDLRGKAILQPTLQHNVGAQIEELYGIKIVKALIGMADPGQDVLQAIHQVVVSKREADALVLMAEARSTEVSLMAQARNAALREEVDTTVAKFRELVASGISEEVAAQFLAASVRAETLRRVAQNGSVLVSDQDGRFVNAAEGVLPAAAMAVPQGLAPLAVPAAIGGQTPAPAVVPAPVVVQPAPAPTPLGPQ